MRVSRSHPDAEERTSGGLPRGTRSPNTEGLVAVLSLCVRLRGRPEGLPRPSLRARLQVVLAAESLVVVDAAPRADKEVGVRPPACGS